MRGRVLTLLSLAAFLLTVAFWTWLMSRTLPSVTCALCIVGGVLAAYPVVWLGRKALDRAPNAERAAVVSAVVHAVLMVLLGTAILEAVLTGESWRGIVVPAPRGAAFFLVQVTSVICLLTVVNLALRGLGAPFAVAQSRRLATDWMYARTRNPMVLSILVCLVMVGLWLQSALFLVWVAVLVTPAWIWFLKVYEERELEIRFGASYHAYREGTPFMIPLSWQGRRGEWYVAAQLLFMALIFFGPRSHASLPAWPGRSAAIWTVAGAALMVAGGAFLLAGLISIRRHLTPLPYPTDGSALVQSGPYSVVRHPMYAGGLVLALGFAVLVRGWLTLVWVAAFAVFVVFKSRREERWLAERFPEYPAYQRRVPMLLPFPYALRPPRHEVSARG